MPELALLLVALAGLWIGTKIALDSTIRFAERCGISEVFLGLTVLALGTDLPELVVAITGGVHQLRGVDASGIVVGNAVGSAIAQGSLVLGVAGLTGYLRLAPRMIRRDGLVLLLSIGLLSLLGLDGEVDRLEGGALLVVYGIYWGMLIQAERPRAKLRAVAGKGLGRTALKVTAGLAIVVLSAEIVVSRSIAIAEVWGIHQTVVGVLLVGVGTSLPELVLSLGAAARGRAGLSVGNVIGSNIFDLLVPVGASGLIHPLVIERATLWADLPFLTLVSVLALVFFTRRRGLQRREALVLVTVYPIFALTRLAFG